MNREETQVTNVPSVAAPNIVATAAEHAALVIARSQTNSTAVAAVPNTAATGTQVGAGPSSTQQTTNRKRPCDERSLALVQQQPQPLETLSLSSFLNQWAMEVPPETNQGTTQPAAMDVEETRPDVYETIYTQLQELASTMPKLFTRLTQDLRKMTISLARLRHHKATNSLPKSLCVEVNIKIPLPRAVPNADAFFEHQALKFKEHMHEQLDNYIAFMQRVIYDAQKRLADEFSPLAIMHKVREIARPLPDDDERYDQLCAEFNRDIGLTICRIGKYFKDKYDQKDREFVEKEKKKMPASNATSLPATTVPNRRCTSSRRHSSCHETKCDRCNNRKGVCGHSQ